MQLLVSLLVILSFTLIFLLFWVRLLKQRKDECFKLYQLKTIELETLTQKLHSKITDTRVLKETIETTDQLTDSHNRNFEGLLEERIVALKASEARYSVLINTVMYPVMVTNFEGNILFMNPKCTEYLNIAQDIANDYTIENFWVDTNERIKFLNELQEKSFVQNMEIKFCKFSGEIAECLISSNIIDYYGQTSVLTVFIDITERKHIETVLAESEILFKSIVNNTNNLICSVSAGDFRLLSFNAALFNYFKSRNIELKIGMTPYEIFGDIEAVNDRIELLKKTFKEGNVSKNEYYSSFNNRWYDFQLNLLKRNGNSFAIAIYGNDITEIKLKENQIKESEEKLRLMLNNSNDAIGLINEAGEQIFLTDASERSTGYSLNELLGPFSEVIYPDDLAIVTEAWQQVLKAKDEVISVQYRHKHKYNGYIWYEAVARNYLDHPALKAVLVNVRDITSLKEAEFKLTTAKEFEERNNERFRTIARLSSHIVYDYDLVNERIYWDGAIKEVTGFEPEEYENVNFKEWSDFLHPDDKEQALEQYRHAYCEIKPYHTQYRYFCKDGSYKWVEEDSHFIEIKSNKPTRLLGVIKDISEQKATKEKLELNEEKYRLLAENINDVIWKFDINSYKYTYFSPSIYKLTGYTVAEATLLSLEDILMPDSLCDLNIVLLEWVRLCESGEMESLNQTIELKIRHKNGYSVWVEVNATLMPDEHGKIYEILATSRNIEERKKLERELLNSVINTEEHDRLKFSQELHDGIGPIISAIKMYIQLILTPETQKDTLEIAKEAEKLIDEASNTVREISYKLSPHILQNYGLVEAVKAYIDKISESRNLNISFQYNSVIRFSELTETIIYRILCECFTNSVKHAQAKNIDVNFELKGNILQVNYVDNGLGFDVENVMIQRKGIGLLNIQSRIKSLNGTLNITSEPGVGTNIYFKVPV